jgi:hypothetical protein
MASPVVGAEPVVSGASLSSLGEEQSGSSMSIRPSPSLSIPSEHCGAGWVVDEEPGGGVVGGEVVELVDPDEEPPALSALPRPGSRELVTVEIGKAAVALPTTASARKAASARISASLLLMRLI